MIKIILRHWRKEDIEPLVKLANNKNIADNLRDRFPHPYTLKDAEEWITLNENKPTAQAGKNAATNFAIEGNGELVGGCGIVLLEDVY